MIQFSIVLLLTAIASLILGLGLPTTANYIVVATLTAPVIVAIGEGFGYDIPLIAVHMFVFFFGILADDTPPVGLAAYAAAAIARTDPIKTGIQGFLYDIRTAILPFMFIFNTKLLLIGDKFMGRWNTCFYKCAYWYVCLLGSNTRLRSKTFKLVPAYSSTNNCFYAYSTKLE